MAADIQVPEPSLSQRGYFSGSPETPISQSWFDAAYASRFSDDPVYKEAYYCDVIGDCKNMSMWIEQFTGYDTTCYTNFSVLEYKSLNQRVKIASEVTIPAYPSTAALVIDTDSYYVDGTFVLPQEGNVLVLPPTGELARVISITGSTNALQMTVQLVNEEASSVTVPADAELFVLAGSELEDCDCPTGQFRAEDAPIEHPYEMYLFGDRGEICGDALNKCQILKIPFTDECGNKIEKWYTEALRRMYKDHETAKHFQRLLNPNFGIIPNVKARAIKLIPASSDEITVEDIREWKALLDQYGVECREFAVFAGTEIYSQFMRLPYIGEGVQQMVIDEKPLNDCRWLNLDWCGIKVEGLTLHIYEECTFSNGKLLGGSGMVFPNSAIFIPMCNRTSNCKGGTDNNKVITTTYFKSLDGRIWDNLTDSNGVLNGPNGRNSFGAGCEQHEWTIKSRFTQVLHCLDNWMYIGLTESA